MKERPIIFNADMVRAILDGRKTQTRRPAKLQPVEGSLESYNREALQAVIRSKCPFGKVGDRLWVREACRAEELRDGNGVIYSADEDFIPIPGTTESAEDWLNLYHYGRCKGKGRTVPSIHMPRWASRITLEIVDVRLERLQSISRDDILAEGFLYPWESKDKYRDWFFGLWNSIYSEIGPDPWVWVVEFKKAEG